MTFVYTHMCTDVWLAHVVMLFICTPWIFFFVCYVYSLWYLYCPGNLFFPKHNSKAWRIFWWNFPVYEKVVLCGLPLALFFMELGYFIWYSEWLWAGWLRNSIHSSGKLFSLLHSILIGSGTHPASCLMGTGSKAFRNWKLFISM